MSAAGYAPAAPTAAVGGAGVGRLVTVMVPVTVGATTGVMAGAITGAAPLAGRAGVYKTESASHIAATERQLWRPL